MIPILDSKRSVLTLITLVILIISLPAISSLYQASDYNQFGCLKYNYDEFIGFRNPPLRQIIPPLSTACHSLGTEHYSLTNGCVCKPTWNGKTCHFPITNPVITAFGSEERFFGVLYHHQTIRFISPNLKPSSPQVTSHRINWAYVDLVSGEYVLLKPREGLSTTDSFPAFAVGFEVRVPGPEDLPIGINIKCLTFMLAEMNESETSSQLSLVSPSINKFQPLYEVTVLSPSEYQSLYSLPSAAQSFHCAGKNHLDNYCECQSSGIVGSMCRSIIDMIKSTPGILNAISLNTPPPTAPRPSQFPIDVVILPNQPTEVKLVFKDNYLVLFPDSFTPSLIPTVSTYAQTPIKSFSRPDQFATVQLPSFSGVYNQNLKEYTVTLRWNNFNLDTSADYRAKDYTFTFYVTFAARAQSLLHQQDITITFNFIEPCNYIKVNHNVECYLPGTASCASDRMPEVTRNYCICKPGYYGDLCDISVTVHRPELLDQISPFPSVQDFTVGETFIITQTSFVSNNLPQTQISTSSSGLIEIDPVSIYEIENIDGMRIQRFLYTVPPVDTSQIEYNKDNFEEQLLLTFNSPSNTPLLTVDLIVSSKCTGFTLDPMINHYEGCSPTRLFCTKGWYGTNCNFYLGSPRADTSPHFPSVWYEGMGITWQSTPQHSSEDDSYVLRLEPASYNRITDASPQQSPIPHSFSTPTLPLPPVNTLPSTTADSKVKILILRSINSVMEMAPQVVTLATFATCQDMIDYHMSRPAPLRPPCYLPHTQICDMRGIIDPQYSESRYCHCRNGAFGDQCEHMMASGRLGHKPSWGSFIYTTPSPAISLTNRLTQFGLMGGSTEYLIYDAPSKYLGYNSGNTQYALYLDQYQRYPLSNAPQNPIVPIPNMIQVNNAITISALPPSFDPRLHEEGSLLHCGRNGKVVRKEFEPLVTQFINLKYHCQCDDYYFGNYCQFKLVQRLTNDWFDPSSTIIFDITPPIPVWYDLAHNPVEISIGVVQPAGEYLHAWRGTVALLQTTIQFPLPSWSLTDFKSFRSSLRILIKQNGLLASSFTSGIRLQPANTEPCGLVYDKFGQYCPNGYTCNPLATLFTSACSFVQARGIYLAGSTEARELQFNKAFRSMALDGSLQFYPGQTITITNVPPAAPFGVILSTIVDNAELVLKNNANCGESTGTCIFTLPNLSEDPAFLSRSYLTLSITDTSTNAFVLVTTGSVNTDQCQMYEYGSTGVKPCIWENTDSCVYHGINQPMECRCKKSSNFINFGPQCEYTFTSPMFSTINDPKSHLAPVPITVSNHIDSMSNQVDYIKDGSQSWYPVTVQPGSSFTLVALDFTAGPLYVSALSTHEDGVGFERSIYQPTTSCDGLCGSGGECWDSGDGILIPANTCRCDYLYLGNQCQFNPTIVVTGDGQDLYHSTIDTVKVATLNSYHSSQLISMMFSTPIDFPRPPEILQFGRKLLVTNFISSASSTEVFAKLPDFSDLPPSVIDSYNILGQFQFPFGDSIYPFALASLPNLNIKSECEWYSDMFKAEGELTHPCYVPNTKTCNLHSTSTLSICTCKDPITNPTTGLITAFSGRFCQHTFTIPAGPYYLGQLIDVAIKTQQFGTTQLAEIDPSVVQLSLIIPFVSSSITLRSQLNHIYVFVIGAPTSSGVFDEPATVDAAATRLDKGILQLSFSQGSAYTSSVVFSTKVNVYNPCHWAQLTHHHTVCYNAYGTLAGVNVETRATFSCIDLVTREIQCQCMNGYGGTECSFLSELQTPPLIANQQKYLPNSAVVVHVIPQFHPMSSQSQKCDQFVFHPVAESPRDRITFNLVSTSSAPALPHCTITTRASTFSYALKLTELPNTPQSYIPRSVPFFISLKKIPALVNSQFTKLPMYTDLITEIKTDLGLECPGDMLNSKLNGCKCHSGFIGPDCSWFMKITQFVPFVSTNSQTTIPFSYIQPADPKSLSVSPIMVAKERMLVSGTPVLLQFHYQQKFRLNLKKVASSITYNAALLPFPSSMSQITLIAVDSAKKLYELYKVRGSDDEWIINWGGLGAQTVGNYVLEVQIKVPSTTSPGSFTTTTFPTNISFNLSGKVCNWDNTAMLGIAPYRFEFTCECFDGYFGAQCNEGFNTIPPKLLQNPNFDENFLPTSPVQLRIDFASSVPSSWQQSSTNYMFIPSQYDSTTSFPQIDYPNLPVPPIGGYNLKRKIDVRMVSNSPSFLTFHRFSLYSTTFNESPVLVPLPSHVTNNGSADLIHIQTSQTLEANKEKIKPAAMTSFGSTIIINIPTINSLDAPSGPANVNVKYYPLGYDGVTLLTQPKIVQTITFPYHPFDFETKITLPATLFSQAIFVEITIPLSTTPTSSIVLSSQNIGTVPLCYNAPSGTTTPSIYNDISKWKSNCTGNSYCSTSANRCVCKPGFTGVGCTTSDTSGPSNPTDPSNPSNPSNPIDPSSPSIPPPGRIPCNQCVSSKTESCDVTVDKCICKTGWGGTTCSVQQGCESQSSKLCSSPNGFLNPPITQGQLCGNSCTCIGQWTGLKCQTCPLQCANGGYAWSTCDRCGCPEGFLGQQCECNGLIGSVTINGYNTDLIKLENYLQVPLSITPDEILQHTELFNGAKKLAHELFSDLLELKSIGSVYLGLQTIYPTTSTTDTTTYPSTKFNLELHYGCNAWNPNVTTDILKKKWGEMTAQLGAENERLNKILIFPSDPIITETDLSPVVDTTPPDDERAGLNGTVQLGIELSLAALIIMMTFVLI